MRRKNRLRKHYYAPVTRDVNGVIDLSAVPASGEFLLLNKWFTLIDSEVAETTAEVDFYHMDGQATDVDNKTFSYPFEGQFDEEEVVHAAIAGYQDKTGDGVYVWFRTVSASGKFERVGIATIHDIVIGGGAPSENEKFNFTIRYVGMPERKEVVGG